MRSGIRNASMQSGKMARRDEAQTASEQVEVEMVYPRRTIRGLYLSSSGLVALVLLGACDMVLIGESNLSRFESAKGQKTRTG